MPTERTYAYEGLFLFPQAAVSDLQGAADHVRTLLTNNGAEILSLFKWDERRLAFEVRGNKRGLYLLAYFKTPGGRYADIERAFNLSEQILRTMIIRADHLTDEQMIHPDKERALADEIKLRREQPVAVPVAAAAAPPPVIEEDDLDLDDE
jgi:small subunit ribosomal protein S6